MTIGELKELLEDYDDALEVRMAHQPNYPLESTIAGVASVNDEEEDDGPQVVYVAEGRQLGYASPRVWEEL